MSVSVWAVPCWGSCTHQDVINIKAKAWGVWEVHQDPRLEGRAFLGGHKLN